MPKKKPSKPFVPDQPYGTIDDVIAEIAGMSIEEIVASDPPEDGRWLITVDELRAAGALDVPPSWRKSLRDDPNPGLNQSRSMRTMNQLEKRMGDPRDLNSDQVRELRVCPVFPRIESLDNPTCSKRN